jgi:hypothetical protein
MSSRRRDQKRSSLGLHRCPMTQSRSRTFSDNTQFFTTSTSGPDRVACLVTGSAPIPGAEAVAHAVGIDEGFASFSERHCAAQKEDVCRRVRTHPQVVAAPDREALVQLVLDSDAKHDTVGVPCQCGPFEFERRSRPVLLPTAIAVIDLRKQHMTPQVRIENPVNVHPNKKPGAW